MAEETRNIISLSYLSYGWTPGTQRVAASFV